MRLCEHAQEPARRCQAVRRSSARTAWPRAAGLSAYSTNYATHSSSAAKARSSSAGRVSGANGLTALSRCICEGQCSRQWPVRGRALRMSSRAKVITATRLSRRSPAHCNSGTDIIIPPPADRRSARSPCLACRPLRQRRGHARSRPGERSQRCGADRPYQRASG